MEIPILKTEPKLLHPTHRQKGWSIPEKIEIGAAFVLAATCLCASLSVSPLKTLAAAAILTLVAGVRKAKDAFREKKRAPDPNAMRFDPSDLATIMLFAEPTLSEEGERKRAFLEKVLEEHLKTADESIRDTTLYVTERLDLFDTDATGKQTSMHEACAIPLGDNAYAIRFTDRFIESKPAEFLKVVLKHELSHLEKLESKEALLGYADPLAVGTTLGLMGLSASFSPLVMPLLGWVGLATLPQIFKNYFQTQEEFRADRRSVATQTEASFIGSVFQKLYEERYAVHDLPLRKWALNLLLIPYELAQRGLHAPHPHLLRRAERLRLLQTEPAPLRTLLSDLRVLPRVAMPQRPYLK